MTTDKNDCDGHFYPAPSTKICAGSVWCADEDKSPIRDIRQIRGLRLFFPLHFAVSGYRFRLPFGKKIRAAIS